MRAPDLWLPLAKEPDFIDGSRMLSSVSAEDDGVDVWGRLAPGSSAQAVAAEMRVLAGELRKQYPNDVWADESLAVSPGGFAQDAGGRDVGDQAPPTLRAKMAPIVAAIGVLSFLILAVACGNLGSLLLARGVARQREISIRLAVGAGGPRLVRQLLTESLVLAMAGAATGLLAGYFVLRTLLAWTEAPAWINVTPDWRVAAFALGIGAAAALLFGLAPAIQVARQSQRASLTRQFLVGAQVAASCLLLILAGLLVRALNYAVSVNPGFEYRNVLTIDPQLAVHGYTPQAARAHLDALVARIAGHPGIESTSLAITPPLANRSTTYGVKRDGRIAITIQLNPITAEYFKTMQLPLLRGRGLYGGESGAVVVSDSLARKLWPGEEPLGKELRLDARYEVVGVAAGVRGLALRDPDAVQAYVPIPASDYPSAIVLVRSRQAPETLMSTLASLSRSVDPKIHPVVRTMNSAFQERLDGPGRTALAVTMLGLVALLLACLGIVGVVAFAVSQRKREIGIRMALGARSSDVLHVVLRQFRLPVFVGLAIGLLSAAGVSRLLRS
jgi:predicted permease